ncbi:MAG TPA: hypothetical protein VF025_09790 [Gaiellaceae bacterium]
MRVLAGLLVLSCLAVPAASAQAALPAIDPSDYVARVTNSWFPLKPGTVYVYRGVKDGKTSRDVVTVTRGTKMIQGVRTTVVSDRLFLAGRLEERTTDWYAQDKRGNVWYFGEATAELDRKGRVTSTEGSWQAGADGARAGIYMPGQPRIGQSGLQEFYRGHAEDHFRVVSFSAAVRVPFVATTHALLTEEWTPLEPSVLDHKYYVDGIGVVKEASVKGPRETGLLVAMRSP